MNPSYHSTAIFAACVGGLFHALVTTSPGSELLSENFDAGVPAWNTRAGTTWGPAGYSYRGNLGGGGWALKTDSAVLPASSTTSWSYEGDIRFLKTNHSVPEYGVGGLLLSGSTTGLDGDYILLNFSRNRYDDGSGPKAYMGATIECKLGGVTTNAVGAFFVDTTGGGPYHLKADWDQTTSTLTLSMTGVGGTSQASMNVTNLAALDGLGYAGVWGYLADSLYDNLSLTSLAVPETPAVVFAEDFESQFVDWDESGTWSIPPSTASPSWFRGDSPAGDSLGWALNPDQLINTPQWNYRVDAKWAASRNPGDVEYGVGGLLLSSSATGLDGDWLAMSYSRVKYDDPDPQKRAWVNAVIEWKLGSSTGSVTGAAFVDYPLGGPYRLEARRRAGGNTVELVVIGANGRSSIVKTFSGEEVSRLATLQYAGLNGYLSVNDFDNVLLTNYLFSEDFESYAPDSYPSPSNPLYGWNAMPSASGLQPAIVTPPVTGTGNALNMNSIGGGGIGWMTVNSPLLASSTSDWSVAANARYLASNNPGVQPWYAWGGLLLSSTGDLSGDWLILGIDVGWGEFAPNVSWSRPMAAWSLGGVSGGGTLFAPVVDDNGAIRMSSDNQLGSALLTASRTGGASTITYVINSPVDGTRTATLNFTGAEAAALNNLKYVGFGNYFNNWQYDNLVVTGTPPTTSQIDTWLDGQPLNDENLLKYGVGGAVTINSPSEAPTSSLDAEKLALTAIVRTDDPEIQVVAETSENLTGWTTSGITSAAAADQSGVAAGFQRRVFSVPRSGGTPPKLFLRLRVLYSP